MAALRAHTSQTRPLMDLVGDDVYREWWRTESFRNADRVGAPKWGDLARKSLIAVPWEHEARRAG